MPLILSGNVATATAAVTYEVANSCRLAAADGARLLRTQGTATSTKTGTVSFWFKGGTIAVDVYIFSGETDASNRLKIHWNSNDDLEIQSKSSNSATLAFTTDAKLKDPTAWYHLVMAVDTDDSTEGNRFKLYLNGNQVTSFSTETYPDEDDTSTGHFVSGATQMIGANPNTGAPVAHFINGYMAECAYCDGQAYAASDFGEFDEDSPTIWKPKDISGLTFGDEGWYLDFEDSSALGNDVSGNNNDFTATNLAAVDQCTDTPTNNFCTLNPIHGTIISSGGLLQSNVQYNKTSTGAGHKCTTLATMAPANGKWYYECKIGDDNDVRVGFIDAEHGAFDSNNSLWDDSGTPSWAWQDNGNRLITDATTTDHFSTYTTNDIISFAIDLDNGKIYAAKNGTWENSGDPTSGATGTGSFADLPATTIFFSPAIGTQDKDASSVHYLNFGNPSYANSSDVADGNGYGKFEYAPPSGYFALCTKNLAEHG